VSGYINICTLADEWASNFIHNCLSAVFFRTLKLWFATRKGLGLATLRVFSLAFLKELAATAPTPVQFVNH
jgi:hypothetical protein